MTETCQHLLVARFDAQPDQVILACYAVLRNRFVTLMSQTCHSLLAVMQLDAIDAQIAGTSQPLDTLSKFSNTALISKVGQG